MAYWHPRIPLAPLHTMTVVSQDTTRVARLAFYMPTFSNLAHLKEVGSKKKITCWHFNLVPTRDFLLPTNSKYAKFEKVGIKMPIWQPWIPPKVQRLKTSQKWTSQ